MGEDWYEGVKTVMKKPKISEAMSLVLVQEECLQVLLDFLSGIDVGRSSGVEEEVEN